MYKLFSSSYRLESSPHTLPLPSSIPNDSQSQCCVKPSTLSSSSGVGSVEEFGGLNTYVTGSPDSKYGIMIVSGVFGNHSNSLFLHSDPICRACLQSHVFSFLEFLLIILEFHAKVAALLLAKDNENQKAAVMLHPSLVTVDDIKEIKVHLAVLGAEFDEVSPPALLKQFEKVLSTRSEVRYAHSQTYKFDKAVSRLV
ncbi:hypothetical protein GIB67_041447 [Kingdonia uniflora]|uniref:Uncharacterized protein n=1 Tax=Kingdonia uniflora TaxID=39325 RepID=A0A7J7LRS7_9MAGN|nr:hypothetical protein GIB67_041447 [Kingdonia uniflora]